MNRSIRDLFPTRRSVLGALLVPVLSAVALTPQASAQTGCPKSQRDVLVFITDLDSPRQSWLQRQFYNAVEFGAETIAQLALTPVYRRVHVARGTAAERADLPFRLRNIASNTAVRAVDLIFVTHGLDGRVAFSDTTVSMTTVRNDIVARVPATLRRKFRMVFSTACYGASHRTGWLEAGFAAASGSRRVYADSAVSFAPFLVAWAAGANFRTSVGIANAADPLRIQDNVAKGLLWTWGFRDWWDVDSTRLAGGRTWLSINLTPR